MAPSFEGAGASFFSTVSLASSGADVVFVAREPLLRDENEDDGRLNRFLGFSEVASTEASVDEATLGWSLNRLRPAVNAPRPRGASVVVVGASVVEVVLGASVVVVVVVGAARDVLSSSFSSTVVASSSYDTVVASKSDFDFLSSSLAFSLARMAYKSIASFSIKGVVSSSSSSTDESVVLAAFSTEDFDAASKASDFDNSVSIILGPLEFLSFSSVTKLWLSTSSRLGRFTCCFLPVSGAFSERLADLARCGKRVT